jgi:hypothetical protein
MFSYKKDFLFSSITGNKFIFMQKKDKNKRGKTLTWILCEIKKKERDRLN